MKCIPQFLFLRNHFSEVEIIGLWVDENWYVNEIQAVT